MAASEEFLEHPIKFLADFLELFLKLAPHSGIQFLNDALQGGFCLHQVIVLGLHKLIPLGNLFIILDGVDVDAAQGTDGRLQFFDPLSHLSEG